MSFSEGPSVVVSTKTQTASESRIMPDTARTAATLATTESANIEPQPVFTGKGSSTSVPITPTQGIIMTDPVPQPVGLPTSMAPLVLPSSSPYRQILVESGPTVTALAPVSNGTTNDTYILGFSIGFGVLGFVSLLGILCFYFWRRHSQKMRLRKTAAWAAEVSEDNRMPTLHRMPVPQFPPNSKSSLPATELDSGMRYELAAMPAEMGVCAVTKRGEVVRWMGEKMRKEHRRSESDMQPIVTDAEGEEDGGEDDEEQEDGQEAALKEELVVELPAESTVSAELPSEKEDTG